MSKEFSIQVNKNNLDALKDILLEDKFTTTDTGIYVYTFDGDLDIKYGDYITSNCIEGNRYAVTPYITFFTCTEQAFNSFNR